MKNLNERIEFALNNAVLFQVKNANNLRILYRTESAFSCICIAYSWPLTQQLNPSRRISDNTDLYKLRDHMNTLLIAGIVLNESNNPI